MRKAFLITAIATGVLLAGAASAPAASKPAPVKFDQAFAQLARTLPVCGADDVTNCRFGTPSGHLEASVQSPTATVYFEMRSGVVTDVEVHPVH